MLQSPKPVPRPHHFFLAHPAELADHAHDLHRALTARGHTVFLDRVSLVPGDLWDQAIHEALGASRVTAVLVTTRPTRGHYDHDEVARAIDRMRRGAHRVVPVFVDEVPTPSRQKYHGLARVVGMSLVDRGLAGVVDGLEDALRVVDVQVACVPLLARLFPLAIAREGLARAGGLDPAEARGGPCNRPAGVAHAAGHS